MLSPTRLGQVQQRFQVNWMMIAATATAVATLSFFILSKKKEKKVTYHQPKSTFPLLGNVLDMGIYHKLHLYDWFLEQTLEAKEKPWLLSIPGSSPILVISKIDLIEDVMRTKAGHFGLSEKRVDVYQDSLGKGILTTDGEIWREHRRLMMTVLSRLQLRSSIYDTMSFKCQQLSQMLEQKAKTNETINLRKIFELFVTDLIVQVSFGVDFNNIEKDQDKHGIMNGLSILSRLGRVRLGQPNWLWQLKRFLQVGLEGEAKSKRENLQTMLCSMIAQTMEKTLSHHAHTNTNTIEKNTSTTSINKNLISMVLDNIKSENKIIKVDVKMMHDIAMNMVAAGRETTITFLSWFFVEMFRHPEILARIKREIQMKVLNTNTTTKEKNKILTLDELQKLTYLEATMCETLRLHPAVPLTTSKAISDIILCDGTFIQKDTLIMSHLYGTGRLESEWGQDVNEFKPERWLQVLKKDPTDDDLLQAPLNAETKKKKMFMFGFGPRDCIGKQFALQEVRIVVTTLLREFDFQLLPEIDPQDFTYEMALTLQVKQPIHVKVQCL